MEILLFLDWQAKHLKYDLLILINILISLSNYKCISIEYIKISIKLKVIKLLIILQLNPFWVFLDATTFANLKFSNCNVRDETPEIKITLPLRSTSGKTMKSFYRNSEWRCRKVCVHQMDIDIQGDCILDRPKDKWFILHWKWQNDCTDISDN